MHQPTWITGGKEVTEDSKVLILLHGRGADATDIMSLGLQLDTKGFSLIAPEATGHTWYPYSFMAPTTQNEPWLSSALQLLDTLVAEVRSKGVKENRICFLGFSQGACLTLEYTTRNAKKYGAVIAFTGGLIGDELDNSKYQGDFGGMPVFIGSSDPDPHVPVARVEESAKIIGEMNAAVTKKLYPGMGHTINAEEMKIANSILAAVNSQ
jgi:phospholipase/carboxylesterase